MSRRTRTAEILAAAKLADLELGREMEQTRRSTASSQALASLVPELIRGGINVYGAVNQQQRADALQTKADERQDRLDARDERDYLADIANRKATSDAQMARADAMKVKLIEIDRYLTEQDAGRLLLTVHDEIGVSLEKDADPEAISKLYTTFDGDQCEMKFRVPITCDWGVGDNWYTAKG